MSKLRTRTNDQGTIALGAEIDDNNATNAKHPNGHLHIPDGVVTIHRLAFWGLNTLTSVSIPEGVTRIEREAFRTCSALTSVTIPKSVRYIGSDAFSGCSALTSATIPEGVKTIEHHAFHGCSALTSVTIPEGVTHIEREAFSGCSALTSITIPESARYIEKSAFIRCTSLSEIICSREQFAMIGYLNKNNIIRYDSQEHKDTLAPHLLGLFKIHFKKYYSLNTPLFFAKSPHSRNTPDDTNIKFEPTENDHTEIKNIKELANKQPGERIANVWQAVASLLISGKLIHIKGLSGNAFEFYLPDGASFKSCEQDARVEDNYSAEEIIQFNTPVSSSMKRSYAQYIRTCLDLKPGMKFQLVKGDKAGIDYILIHDTAPEAQEERKTGALPSFGPLVR